MLNKHKLFLLCAKWIPVVTAIGILVTNTIAYYGCNDIVVDIFNFNIGTSVAGVILMYVCSYAFNFCIWHKLVITYNALIIAIVFIIRYCITECSYSYLLLSYYILAGIILLLILYIHSKKKIFSLMEKTNCLLDVVKNQLQNAISNIDAGNSNLNEEEMEELVKTLSVLNKGVKRISKAYACEHILHCSPATFDNYVRAGIIPKGKKEVGFNELSWSLKDFDGVKLQRIHKK